jgi:hypothetical protein
MESDKLKRGIRRGFRILASGSLSDQEPDADLLL